jgi:HEAT repeat protein
MEIARSPEALLVASRLAASSDVLEQAVAAHVLGAMADGSPGRAPHAVAVLKGMLSSAGDLHLTWSIADALRLSADASATEPLVALVDSPSANVRRTVAMGLGAAMVDGPSASGLHALIRLSRDPDSTVRDWATFGLAQLDDSSSEVLSALWERVDDPHYNTRSEALAGLAARHVAAIADRVRAELESDYVGRLVIQAAADLADPLLLRPLLSLREWWDVDTALLERAIHASGDDTVS